MILLLRLCFGECKLRRRLSKKGGRRGKPRFAARAGGAGCADGVGGNNFTL